VKRLMTALQRPQGKPALDEMLSSAALLLMVLIPVLEILMRPFMGSGIENAPVLVQHLGLVLTMCGVIKIDIVARSF
jgi:hypothetical protein